MIQFTGNLRYTITRTGSMDDWMATMRAILSLMSNQNEQNPADPFDVHQACLLLLDMLPDEEQAAKMQAGLMK